MSLPSLQKASPVTVTGFGSPQQYMTMSRIVYAPVDQRAAAGDGLGGEGAAQTGNGAVGAEADVDVEDLAQLAVVDVLLDEVDAVVEAVDHADVQDACRSRAAPSASPAPRRRCGRRAFRTERPCRRASRRWRWWACTLLGVQTDTASISGSFRTIVIVGDGRAAAVLLHGGLGALGNDVAEILDFHFGIVHVRRECGRRWRCCRSR